MRSFSSGFRRVSFVVATACVWLHGCGLESRAPATAAPRKVVLLVGDGMDDQQITIARNYLAGNGGRLRLDDMPERSAVQFRTVAEDDTSVPIYVPDSANTATSMSSGIVTSAGRIATTAKTDRDVPTIMELANAAGFGTGIVTTSSVTDATPASFVAHVSERLCESPSGMVRINERIPAFSTDCSADLKANGGRGSIAEQIAASRIDIVLGGGAQYFDEPAEGATATTVRDLAAANGFHLIGTRAELQTLPPDGKVLALFSRGTMPVQWRGTDDAAAARVSHRDDGRFELPEPFTCEPNPTFDGSPRLVEMARIALERLDGGRSFVLMIESASIDKQSHLRRPCGQIGELAQLDETLGVVLEYAREHPETLVLVTADHSQAAQLVPETSALAALNAASPGYLARLRTPEGGIMGVGYATNDSTVQEDHTGAQVPLFASGLDRELPALIQQTEIFELMAAHLGLL
jgi:alkaline phosphatase